MKIRAFADEVLRLKDPDEVKIMLGERLDIWPASIFPGLEELQAEPDLSVVDQAPDLGVLEQAPDLTGLDPDLGDLPAVMVELDKLGQ